MKTICIIDSGYNKEINIDGLNIIGEIGIKRADNGDVVIENDATDQIGHGTAILSIIHKYCINVNIFLIKVFYDELTCDEEILVKAIEYVYDNIDCDILNISCGISLLKARVTLINICNRLSQRNTLIVSAFDNNGSISYPAGFSSVIGVDSDPICKKHSDIVCVQNSIVDVFGYGGTQRVPWLEPKYIFVSGASYACAHISSILFNSDCKNKNDAISFLTLLSRDNIIINNQADYNNCISNISSAAVILFNKEIHSLARFSSLLTFSLFGIYDFAKLGNVNRKISSYLNDDEVRIKNIDDLPWNGEFDTVIIGHIGEISGLYSGDILKKIIDNCIKYKKNIYSFDSLDMYKPLFEDRIEVNWPKLTSSSKNNFGKLYSISKPVLGVFGTSASQGKFSLQLYLRNMFIDNGYSIGQIGTEPSSLLFGMDDVVHFGYGSEFKTNGFEFVKLLNEKINNIQSKDVDIIIVGSQSNTIPYAILNEKYLTIPQIEFLFGVNPDRVILCINPHDDISYVKRTISAIESLVDCKVIALVLYPLGYYNIWSFGGTKNVLNDFQVREVKSYFSMETNLPCLTLGQKEDMIQLFDIVINSFEKGE